jgi:hypothetical protein
MYLRGPLCRIHNSGLATNASQTVAAPLLAFVATSFTPLAPSQPSPRLIKLSSESVVGAFKTTPLRIVVRDRRGTTPLRIVANFLGVLAFIISE